MPVYEYHCDNCRREVKVTLPIRQPWRPRTHIAEVLDGRAVRYRRIARTGGGMNRTREEA
jgi:predicted nucleic acid-binding Zn ribbon protein